jgi:hypothetical protein
MPSVTMPSASPMRRAAPTATTKSRVGAPNPKRRRVLPGSSRMAVRRINRRAPSASKATPPKATARPSAPMPQRAMMRGPM